MPFWGGENFEFFKPVFNIADSSITVGVLNILLFQRSFFNQDPEEAKKEVVAETDANTDTETAENAETAVAETTASVAEDEDAAEDNTSDAPSEDEDTSPDDEKEE